MAVVAYRDRFNGRYPITLDELRANAGVLFGGEPTNAILDSAKVDPVEAVEPPPYDPATHSIAENDPVYVGGAWRQSWSVLLLPPPPIPQEVTRRQAKIVLSRAGILALADTAIAEMTGQAGQEARIDWTDASVFRRDNPLIAGLGAALGLSSAQIDALFVQAAAIA